MLCRSIVVPTSLGLRTSGAKHLSGVRPGVAMLAIPRDQEHQALTCANSVSVTVPGPPVTGGLLRTGAGRVSCVHDQRGGVEAHPPIVGGRNPCGASVVYDGRPAPCCRRGSIRAPALMRHREKRRCSPTRTRRERGAHVPGPKSGVHGLTCVGREGTACTKVVL